MNLRNKALNSFSWQFLSVLTKAVLQLLVLAILARLLTPRAFGLIALVHIVTSVSNLFTKIGLGPALIQKKEINDRHTRIAWTTTVLLAVAVYFVIFISKGWISGFFDEPKLTALIPVASLAIPISAFGIVPRSLMERKLDFKDLFKINFSSYLFGYAVPGIVLAYYDYGVWSLVAAVIGQKLILSLSCYLKIRNSLVPLLRFREAKDLFVYSGGLTLSRTFNQVANRGDFIMIGKLLGTEALGLYERIFKIMVMPGKYLGKVLDKVLFPVLSNVQENKKRLQEGYLRAVSVVNSIMMPLAFLFIMYSYEIVYIALGEDWLQAVLPLQILFAGISFRTTSRIADSLSRAVGAVYKNAWIKGIYGLNVLLFCYLGHFWDLLGIVIGINIAVLINYFLLGALCIYLTKITFFDFISSHKEGLLNFLVIGLTSIAIYGITVYYFDNLFLVLGISCSAIAIAIVALFINDFIYLDNQVYEYFSEKVISKLKAIV